MRKQEMLAMSVKERDRLKVLHEVKQGHLTQRAAAEQLGVTDRWVRKLLVRVEEGRRRGDRASAAGPGVESALAGESAGQGTEVGEGEVPRLWPHAGVRILGQGRRGGGEQGDAAAVADRGGVAAGEAAAGGGGARSGGRGGAVGESWCSGTPRCTTGWKGGGRGCTWWR